MRQYWKYAHATLTLASVACCIYLLVTTRSIVPLDRDATHADFRLRALLKTRWIGGDYKLPEEEQHCAIAIFHFKDGRFEQRGVRGVWSVAEDGSRTIPHGVMWLPKQDGSGALIQEFEYTSTVDKEHIMAKLDGQLGRSYGSSNLGMIHDYRVIGMAMSQAKTDNKRRVNFATEDAHAIFDHKYALALVVKPFATREEAHQWVHGDTFHWPGD